MTPAVRAVVERIVGPVRRVTEHTQEHGVTGVFRADDVWVKVHRGPRKYAQERLAYREVAPGLARAGFRVPELLGHDDGHHVLVVSHLAGEPAEGVADRRDLHRQAGELLAVLHDLPCDRPDPLPLSEALVLRHRDWVARARPHLPAALLDRVSARLGDGALFEGLGRRWCHRDFSPRNWLAFEGRLGLIDFEHTRPDVWHVDLERLVTGDWAANPDTRRAFFEGHPPLSELDRERLDVLVLVQAVSTVAWAEEHDDRAFAAFGRRVLAQLEPSSAARISSAEA